MKLYPKSLSFFLILIFFSFIVIGDVFSEHKYLDCDATNKSHQVISKTIAKEYLKKIQSSYSKLEQFKVLFTQHSFLAALEEDEESSGYIFFKKIANMRWIYNEPDEQEFLIKDKNFYFYQKQDEQVLVQDIEDVLNSNVPIAFLFGLGSLSKDFNFKIACKVKTKKDKFQFVLTPKVKEEVTSFTKLIIQNNKKFYPEIIQVHHVGGNITSIKLSDFNEEVALEESDFILDIPKGVDIIDKR